MKKFNAVSLFANVGVAEAYLAETGINVAVANEIDPIRAKFYSHLYPETNMIVGDITKDGNFDLQDLSNLLFHISNIKEFGEDKVLARNPEEQKWYYTSVYKSCIANVDENHPIFVRYKKILEEIWK